MKLPAETTIAPVKFTRYLLVPQLRSDKSRCLARAGYTPANVERLIVVRTVWQRHALSGSVHFVTLIPKPQLTA